MEQHPNDRHFILIHLDPSCIHLASSRVGSLLNQTAWAVVERWNGASAEGTVHTVLAESCRAAPRRFWLCLLQTRPQCATWCESEESEETDWTFATFACIWLSRWNHRQDLGHTLKTSAAMIPAVSNGNMWTWEMKCITYITNNLVNMQKMKSNNVSCAAFLTLIQKFSVFLLSHFMHFLIFLNISQHFSTCLNISQHFSTCLNISHRFRL